MEKQECNQCKGTGRIFEKHINIECNKCNGTGVISNELEQKCERCNGKGHILSPNINDNIKCPTCDGLGTIPNELGEKILELVIKNFKQIVKEIIND